MTEQADLKQRLGERAISDDEVATLIAAAESS